MKDILPKSFVARREKSELADYYARKIPRDLEFFRAARMQKTRRLNGDFDLPKPNAAIYYLTILGLSF